MRARSGVLKCLCVLMVLMSVAPCVRAEVESTERFRLHWEVDAVPADLVPVAMARCEEVLSLVLDLIGEDFTPKEPVHVLLHGEARPERGEIPHVDSFGRVHLYQFGPDAISHLSPLAHELVHSLRNPHLNGRNNFLEEGFASFVALTVDPTLPGFPFYNTPVHVVAGQWLGGDEEVSLVELAHDHKRLNLPCKTQSYSMRASFFEYLSRIHGQAQVANFASASRSADPDYAHWFGLDLPGLATMWREDLWNRYTSDSQAAELSRQYRAGPAKWTPPCDASAQTVTVENPEDPSSVDLELELVEQWRVGGKEQDHLFGVVSRVRVALSGEIYVLDDQLAHVCVFSADGEYLRELGRAGEGPGEFQHPTDLVLLADDAVGVVEVIPANLEVLDSQGTPTDSPYVFDSGAYGELYRAERFHDVLVTAGSLRGQGSSRRQLSMQRPAHEAREIHSQESSSRYGGMEYDEQSYVGFQRRWTLTTDGVVVLAPKFDAYELEFWSLDTGRRSRVSKRPAFAPVARSRDWQRSMQRVYEEQISWNPDSSFQVSKHHETISEMYPRPDGALWVLTAEGRFSGRFDGGLMLDEVNRKGEFTRRVFLRGDVDPQIDGFHFHDDYLYVVRRQHDAVVAASGGRSDDSSADEGGEVELVCFRIEPWVSP